MPLKCKILALLRRKKEGALQMHCTENLKQIFPEMKLRGLVPNFYVHVSVSDLYISMIGPQMQYRKTGGPIVGLYKSLTDTCMQKLRSVRIV